MERQEKEEELLSRAGSISNFSKWLEKELPADVLRMEAELGGTLHVEDAVLEDVV